MNDDGSRHTSNRTASPRIAIDARKLGDTGLGRYTQMLLAGLATVRGHDAWQWRAFSHAHRWQHLADAPSGMVRDTVYSGSYSPAQHIEFAVRLSRDPISIFHATNFTTPLLVPRRTKLIVTVHDLAFLTMPHFARRGIAMPVQLLAYRVLLRLAIHRADHVCTLTHAVGTEVARAFPTARPKLAVLPPAVDTVPITEPRGTPSAPVVLFVGMLSARKGIATLVEAYAATDLPQSEVALVLIGPAHQQYRAVIGEDITRRGLQDRVTITGRISDDALRQWFARAAVVVLPSFLEGFGIPVLEAMALGIPCVASDLPAIREVSGGAALLVPAGDADALGAAISRAVHDAPLRAEMIARGLERAREFTVEKLGARTMALYRELLDR